MRRLLVATAHTDPMTRDGDCPPHRTRRAAGTLELWDPRGSSHVVGWRRAALVAESALAQRPAALTGALAAVQRRRPGGEPHEAPRRLAWLLLRLEAAVAGWRWGLVIDDRLVPLLPYPLASLRHADAIATFEQTRPTWLSVTA